MTPERFIVYTLVILIWAALSCSLVERPPRTPSGSWRPLTEFGWNYPYGSALIAGPPLADDLRFQYELTEALTEQGNPG